MLTIEDNELDKASCRYHSDILRETQTENSKKPIERLTNLSLSSKESIFLPMFSVDQHKKEIPSCLAQMVISSGKHKWESKLNEESNWKINDLIIFLEGFNFSTDVFYESTVLRLTLLEILSRFEIPCALCDNGSCRTNMH